MNIQNINEINQKELLPEDKYWYLIEKLGDIFYSCLKDKNPSYNFGIGYRRSTEFEIAFWCVCKYYCTISRGPNDMWVINDITTPIVRELSDGESEYCNKKDYDYKYYFTTCFDTENSKKHKFEVKEMGEFWQPIIYNNQEEALGKWLSEVCLFLIPFVKERSFVFRIKNELNMDIIEQMNRNEEMLWRIVKKLNKNAYKPKRERK